MKQFTNSLFWRLSLFFLSSLLIIASLYIYITYRSSLEYSQETAQKLSRPLAKRIAKETKPFIDGQLNETELEEVFHNVMILNPSVEVYLLDTTGSILSFFAPFGKVKLDRVDLAPIRNFIADEDLFVKGEDPRNPGVFKAFSASKVVSDGAFNGYIYVILASEEYTTITGMLENSFRMKLATQSILITLIATLLIGLLTLWYLTRNLNTIIKGVKQFKEGDLNARIDLKSKGELSVLAQNINSMSDTIVANINEIKSVENLRKELITNVSHDLRTPLTSIQGYAETLVMMNKELSEEDQLKYQQIILNSTEKVKKLVDDLFEISKLESNQVKASKEQFSLPEMLSDISAKYELIAQSKKIDLELDIAENTPPIYGDIALIDRVIQNLCDNAIKHTPEGGKITIAVQPKKGQVDVTIKDTGIGIPKEELPYIFERYKKAKGNVQAGSGLGLAIVKKILELHQSEIQVISEVSKGSLFSFSLPVA